MLAELSGFFTRGVRPFYAACRFDELNRGSVSCFFNTSFESDFHNAGVCRVDMGQIPTQSRRPVASRVALDLPYWSMRSTLYRLIRKAIKMASKVGAFVSVVAFLSCITVAKRPCCGPLKIKPSYIIVHYHVIM